MIYAQSGLLYEIIPNAPRSSFNPRVKPRPHADGIVGCASAKPVDSVAKQVSQLSINQSALGQAMASSQPAQMASVLSVQSLNQKGNQQPGRNKKKGKKNCKGGNRNENANNNDKNTRNAGGTSKLNIRLNSLASCVRTITSLTCALVSMKPQDSRHRAQLC